MCANALLSWDLINTSICFGGQRKRDMLPTLLCFKCSFSQGARRRGYVLLCDFLRIVALCNSNQKIFALLSKFWRPLTKIPGSPRKIVVYELFKDAIQELSDGLNIWLSCRWVREPGEATTSRASSPFSLSPPLSSAALWTQSYLASICPKLAKIIAYRFHQNTYTHLCQTTI